MRDQKFTIMQFLLLATFHCLWILSKNSAAFAHLLSTWKIVQIWITIHAFAHLSSQAFMLCYHVFWVQNVSTWAKNLCSSWGFTNLLYRRTEMSRKGRDDRRNRGTWWVLRTVRDWAEHKHTNILHAHSCCIFYQLAYSYHLYSWYNGCLKQINTGIMSSSHILAKKSKVLLCVLTHLQTGKTTVHCAKKWKTLGEVQILP